MIKRGEVYWVSFDPAVGGEMKKMRPAVIVSNDINNMNSTTVTVLPLTSAVQKIYPFEVMIKAGSCGNREACKAKADQIRTVDKARLRKAMGFLPQFLMPEIDRAIRLPLSL